VELTSTKKLVCFGRGAKKVETWDSGLGDGSVGGP
jgi:hypothetical protein